MARVAVARIAGRIGALVAALLIVAAPAQAAMITFSPTVVDFDAPTNFLFQFSTPLSPELSGLIDVSATLDVTVTDGGSDGASFTGLHSGGGSLKGFADLPSLGTPLGIEIGPSCVVPLGGPTSPSGGTATCTFSGFTTITWPILEQNLSALIYFSLSGGGDKAAVTGSITAVPHVGPAVPEPASLGLLGIGLAAVSALRRRRRA